MDRNKLFLLIGAVVLVIATAFALRSFLTSSPPPPPVAAPVSSGPKVLVALRALPVGTIITEGAVGFQDWPSNLVDGAYFKQEDTVMNKQVLGTVVKNAITAGQPVTKGSLVAPGDRGFLAAALGAGMRAVAIPVNANAGVAGFIFPGDHVDLLLSQTVAGGGTSQPLRATETILQNLRVLATDQSTVQTKKEDGQTEVKAFNLVTVEVTPKIAEQLAVAQTIGSITLSLRSIADNTSDLERAVASGQVKIPAGTSRQQEDKLIQGAMSRPITTGSSFVTGGDVSRFQRKSVPAVGFFDPSGQPVVPSGPAGPTSVVKRGPTVRVTRGGITVEVPINASGSF